MFQDTSLERAIPTTSGHQQLQQKYSPKWPNHFAPGEKWLTDLLRFPLSI